MQATVHFFDEEDNIVYKVEGILCETFFKDDDEDYVNAIIDKIAETALAHWRADHAGTGLPEPTTSDMLISYQY